MATTFKGITGFYDFILKNFHCDDIVSVIYFVVVGTMEIGTRSFKNYFSLKGNMCEFVFTDTLLQENKESDGVT